MNSSFFSSLKSVFTPDNLKDYKSYYCALRNWIIDNKEAFSEKSLLDNRLKEIISMPIDKIAFEDIMGNGMILLQEEKRIASRDYKSCDALLSVISDTLWDLITINSSVECGKCKYGDMRYVIVNYMDNKSIVVLECKTCGHVMKLDGSNFAETINSIIPATKTDISGI